MTIFHMTDKGHELFERVYVGGMTKEPGDSIVPIDGTWSNADQLGRAVADIEFGTISIVADEPKARSAIVRAITNFNGKTVGEADGLNYVRQTGVKDGRVKYTVQRVTPQGVIFQHQRVYSGGNTTQKNGGDRSLFVTRHAMAVAMLHGHGIRLVGGETAEMLAAFNHGYDRQRALIYKNHQLGAPEQS